MGRQCAYCEPRYVEEAPPSSRARILQQHVSNLRDIFGREILIADFLLDTR